MLFVPIPIIKGSHASHCPLTEWQGSTWPTADEKDFDMKSIFRIAVPTLCVAGALLLNSSWAQAAEYCAKDSAVKGCFSTLAQCQASVAGAGGNCVEAIVWNDAAVAHQPKQGQASRVQNQTR
jgi:hypothetical protein